MKSATFKHWLIILCFALLTHCASVSDSHFQVNQQLVSPYTMPAKAYLAIAKTKLGEERQHYQIMAAGRLIYDGQWRQGNIILSRLKPLSPIIADEKNLLQAKIYSIREQWRTVIKILSRVKSIDALTIYYKAQYYELLAQAYKGTGNIADSVEERMKLNQVLPDQASRVNNLRALWLTLTELPSSELNAMAIEAEDGSEFKGWMDLALISRKDYNDPHTMMVAIQAWKQSYPGHPANALIQQSNVDNQLFSRPKQIALLLPLTGPLAGPGGAIRDGFMAAYRSSSNAGRISIKTYNTNTANVAKLYDEAVSDGADYVVGPLRKDNVTTVSQLNHPVPTLLMNDIGTSTRQNAYQLGLSPSNEARQVASKARRNGYTRALVIAPDGDWGAEVMDAFTQQWRANGGHVVDTLLYQPNTSFNQPIRDFLRISESEARKKAIAEVLRRKVEATPRRRQDFDMIFLLAYPSKARQIMPLLRYYYAGDVPVYSTSSVYGGYPNSIRNRDLDGIIFCDMPWVFDHNLGHKNWPEQLNSYNRLYALGMDSYALSNQLNQLLLFLAMGVRDNSGILYLNTNGQVGRILSWGQFKRGIAEQINKKAVT
jgi:uncharacterized protein